MKRLICILFSLVPFIVNSQQTWYKSSPLDYMWKYVGNADLSDRAAIFTSLAFSPIDGQPYVAYSYDEYPYINQLCVKKFDGTNWIYVGNPGFSVSQAWWLSLAFNSAGQPYVAFCGNLFDSLGKASVMKFNGNDWAYVGDSVLPAIWPWFTSLAFSISGDPYVALSDGGYSGKVTVMKFDGVNWEYVGNPGFSAASSEDINLVFGPSGEPYVAYSDSGYHWKATVMKFDGLSWVNIGSPGFSVSKAYYTSLAFNSAGEPYVAFSDSSVNWKATVMKFDGTSWVNVGSAGFSASTAYFESLAFGTADEPFVAFSDYSNSQKTTVMKFNGTAWLNVGIPGFSTENSMDISLAFNFSGEPYVAYRDGGVSVMKYDSVYVGINNHENNHIVVYPNPAENEITINFRDDLDDLKNLEISDIRGMIVFKTLTSNNRITVDINDLPAGIYVVKSTSEGSNTIGKFCKD